MLDHRRDGLEQLLASLARQSAFDAIHPLNHGDIGLAKLGALTLSADGPALRHKLLASLGPSPPSGSDLLNCGWDVARGVAGAEFVDRLRQVPGTAVAEPTDLTVSTSGGVNWH